MQEEGSSSAKANPLLIKGGERGEEEEGEGRGRGGGTNPIGYWIPQNDTLNPVYCQSG